MKSNLKRMIALLLLLVMGLSGCGNGPAAAESVPGESGFTVEEFHQASMILSKVENGFSSRSGDDLFDRQTLLNGHGNAQAIT